MRCARGAGPGARSSWRPTLRAAGASLSAYRSGEVPRRGSGRGKGGCPPERLTLPLVACLGHPPAARETFYTELLEPLATPDRLCSYYFCWRGRPSSDGASVLRMDASRREPLPGIEGGPGSSSHEGGDTGLPEALATDISSRSRQRHSARVVSQRGERCTSDPCTPIDRVNTPVRSLVSW
jgi:hypothetical protein